MLRLLLGLTFASLLGCASLPPAPRTEVMVVASIHGAHRDHPAYSYDDLYGIVRAFEPDLVAVEIRPEDMGRDADYLARNYPLEMRELAQAYAPNVRGVDWLGSELEGRPVPPDWWREHSPIKRLERELAADESIDTSAADRFQAQQAELVRSQDAAGLNDGRYDEATRSYYRALSEALAGTRYQPLTDFYRERDRRIADNVAQLVDEHPGRRIAVIVGADHRAPVIDELGRRFGPGVDLVPVR